jgi:hypothetical protein
LNVLKDFFSRSDTTTSLAKSIFERLALRQPTRGRAAFCSSLSYKPNQHGLDHSLHLEPLTKIAFQVGCQNMPQLHRLGCTKSSLGVDGVRAFEPALRTNRLLKELDLSACRLGDEGIRLVVDGLGGNTTMNAL